jgi:hypothetical protein
MLRYAAGSFHSPAAFFNDRAAAELRALDCGGLTLMTRPRLPAKFLAFALLLHARAAIAQVPQLTEQEVHDRIVAVIARNAIRPLPPGDTFVTWSPGPVLYSTVQRTDTSVWSSLVRNDAMQGTALAKWRDGVQHAVHVLWTRRDSTLLEIAIQVTAQGITLSGRRDSVMPQPSIPWAVADYGMEDQLLPLVTASTFSTTPQRVLAFRPYTQKWDTLSVTVARPEGATVVTVTAPDGEHFFWLVSPDGALIRITRDRHLDSERRPLEKTWRVRDYLRLRRLTSP